MAGTPPTKFGLRASSRGAARRAPRQWRSASLVSPAPVDTALWDAVNPDEREGFTPRAAMLRPEDVAAAVLYAVSQPAVGQRGRTAPLAELSMFIPLVDSLRASPATRTPGSSRRSNDRKSATSDTDSLAARSASPNTPFAMASPIST